ncbi:MAG: acyl-CoA thioesterase [Myxococcales bacterium]|nr:acyl-CoA thioesterase [Myxococcales bacterium]MDD9971807.1 acyl-CoA thioesterase [Myxococcales bacterium]
MMENDKTPAATRTEMTQLVMPTHSNSHHGVMFGGVVMQWIDICAGIAAMRHAKSDCVTASIDRMDFLQPILVGDIVRLRAQVNATFGTSMEVGCRVESLHRHTDLVRYTTKAYLTFVSVDGEGRPQPVPPLALASDNDRRRQNAATERRQIRLEERERARGRMAPKLE